MKLKRLNPILSILLTIFFAFSVFGQENINQFDTDGLRTGKWKKFHPNKRIRYEGQFLKGKETGVFKYYSILNSDHPVAIKTFLPDSDLAEVTFYTNQGVLESSGKMKGKNRIGKWLYYHADGTTLMSEENYKNGVLSGTVTTYFKTGQVTEIANYLEGRRDGKLFRYSDSGVLLDDLIYANGKLHGLAKYYNTKGELTYTGKYENDEKVGDWKYFQNGKLVPAPKIKQ